MSNPNEALPQTKLGSTTAAPTGLNGSAPAFRTDGTRPPGPRAQFRLALVSFLAAGIGLAAGAIALVLYKLIGLFTNLFFYHRWDTSFASARLNQLGWWVIVTPVIGGLIVGVMAKYGSAKIKGHGIPEAMEAVLFNRSRIQPRVAILKPLSAAIAIGTGGPFGAEGPIIQTGGAVGSLVGQVFHTTGSERKVLLACGAAAGMASLLISGSHEPCRFTWRWAGSVVWPLSVSASCFIGWKINSKSSPSIRCGGRPSARWAWASSAISFRASWAWATTPSATS